MRCPSERCSLGRFCVKLLSAAGMAGTIYTIRDPAEKAPKAPKANVYAVGMGAKPGVSGPLMTPKGSRQAKSPT